MHVVIERANITLSCEEINEIYFSLMRRLKTTIKEHWVRHPDAFEHSEARALRVIRALAGYAGRCAHESIEELKQALADAVEDRADATH